MAKAKQNEEVAMEYCLTTYKSDNNGRTKQEYATLAEAQTAMREDYEAEIQHCIEHGQQPASAYICQWSAYIVGVRKCQWQINEL